MSQMINNHNHNDSIEFSTLHDGVLDERSIDKLFDLIELKHTFETKMSQYREYVIEYKNIKLLYDNTKKEKDDINKKFVSRLINKTKIEVLDNEFIGIKTRLDSMKNAIIKNSDDLIVNFINYIEQFKNIDKLLDSNALEHLQKVQKDLNIEIEYSDNLYFDERKALSDAIKKSLGMISEINVLDLINQEYVEAVKDIKIIQLLEINDGESTMLVMQVDSDTFCISIDPILEKYNIDKNYFRQNDMTLEQMLEIKNIIISNQEKLNNKKQEYIEQNLFLSLDDYVELPFKIFSIGKEERIEQKQKLRKEIYDMEIEHKTICEMIRKIFSKNTIDYKSLSDEQIINLYKSIDIRYLALEDLFVTDVDEAKQVLEKILKI